MRSQRNHVADDHGKSWCISNAICNTRNTMTGPAILALIQARPGVRRTMLAVMPSTTTPNALKTICPTSVFSTNGYSSMPNSCISSKIADG